MVLTTRNNASIIASICCQKTIFSIMTLPQRPRKPKANRKTKNPKHPLEYFSTLLTQPFFACLHYLSSSLRQDTFTDVLDRLAAFTGAATELTEQQFGPFQPRLSFSARPTVVLRATVPSTGFSITFQAMLDSGASHSVMSGSLARVLLANGATCKYRLPFAGGHSPFTQIKSLDYRLISGLRIQSCEVSGPELGEELEEEDVATIEPDISITIGEYSSYYSDLNVMLLLEKMDQLGLPLVKRYETDFFLGRTTWTVMDQHSFYRVDLLVGQDLLNSHFNVQPLQRSYHVTPSLVLLRTKMGLAFMGHFNVNKFKTASLSADELQKIKETLYPERYPSRREAAAAEEAAQTLSPAQKEEIQRILSFDLASIRRSPCEYIYSFLCLFFFFHFLIFMLMWGPINVFLRWFLLVTGAHNIEFVYRLYTFSLVTLFNMVLGTVHLFSFSTIRLVKQLKRTSAKTKDLVVSPDCQLYDIAPVLQMEVKKEERSSDIENFTDNKSKTILALIDTGSCYSIISARLVKELKLKPYREKVYDSPYEEGKKEKIEYFYLEVGKTATENNLTKFTKISCLMLSVGFETPHRKLPLPRIEALACLLNIPMNCSASFHKNTCEDLLLGTDVIPSLLMPACSTPTRIVPLAKNLAAIETRFGYYLQGGQFKFAQVSDSKFSTSSSLFSSSSSDVNFVYNWAYCPMSEGWREWTTSCTYFVMYSIMYCDMMFNFIIPKN